MNIETANKLLELRKLNKLSQEDLAEKLGVSRQAVSKWERAEASPDTENLILLAKLYNISLDELLNIDIQRFKNEKKTKSINLTKSNDTSSQIHEVQENVFNASNYMISPVNQVENVNIISKPSFKFKNNKFEFLENIGNALETFMIHHKLTYKSLYLFPWYAVAVIMFFLSGYFIGYNISWGWFLTIPLYYTTIKCIQDRNLYIFCYPIICLMIFCMQTYLFGGGLSWLWFLTIPLYYTIIPAVKKNNPLIFCYPVVAIILFLFFGYLFSYNLSLIFLATIPFYYWYFYKKR